MKLTETERWRVINALRMTAIDNLQRARQLRNTPNASKVIVLACALEDEARDSNRLADAIEDADDVEVA
jgi:hypothetical protein